MHRSHVSLVSAPSQPPPNAPTSTRTPTPQREACTPALPPNAVDSATVGFADAFRLFVRDAVHQELTGLKEELLQAFRNSRTPSPDGPQRDSARLLSVAEVAERVGSSPATIREWIKEGYFPAVSLGPAGRRYGIRWGDVEASLAHRKKREIPMDADAEASHILAAARARATRRRGT